MPNKNLEGLSCAFLQEHQLWYNKGLEEREVMRVETAELNCSAKKIRLYPLSKEESFFKNFK